MGFFGFSMDVLIQIFGEGKELNCLQMSCRGIVIFIIALLLIRISGRRSFSLHTPLDNIIAVLLGGILSRAVAGASPFLSVLAASAVIVLLHRGISYLTVRNPGFSKVVQGEKILLYERGQFMEENMKKALVCREDVIQGIRKSALTDSLQKIEKVYIERNGEISVIKKDSN